jgi:hypothetical protein
MNHRFAFLFIVASLLHGGHLSGDVEELMLEAVKKGDTDAVTRLRLENDSDLNTSYGPHGDHLLYIAFTNDDLPMFRHLLMHGADPNQPSHRKTEVSVGARILGVAFKEEFLVESLRYGMDPNQKGPRHNLGPPGPSVHLLFKTAPAPHRIPYFVILTNHGACLGDEREWLELFYECMKSNNTRLAHYLVITDRIRVEDDGFQAWWEKFADEQDDLFIRGNSAERFFRGELFKAIQQRLSEAGE